MNKTIENWFLTNSDNVIELAKEIWSNPELSMEEYNSCAKTAAYMKKHGFDVLTYNCRYKDKEPNTVVATWGRGRPVIGILGEYDALVGLGQEAVPYESRIPGVGHGCGHSLMAPACGAAAVAAKAALEAEGLPGTIKFFACPAEEILAGKLYMARDGAFDGLDCCVSWHPDSCDITPLEGIRQAISMMTFEFFGKPAHAASRPDKGRSALDAAEIMNIGVQFLREHMTNDCRIHYTFLAAGDKANIVPEYASLSYQVRSKDLESNKILVERVKKVAEGAAIMTETEVKITLDIMAPETLVVNSFNDFLYKSIIKVPPLEYSDEEVEFARTLYKNVVNKEPSEDVLFNGVEKPTGISEYAYTSTDAGYITYLVPTSRLFGPGVVKDVPAHHWGVTATSGMSIGFKAAIYAGKAIAQAVYDICREPENVKVWWDELKSKRGNKDFEPVWPE